MDFKNPCRTSEDVSSFLSLLKKLSSSNVDDYKSILVTFNPDILNHIFDAKVISEITFYNPKDVSNDWKYLCTLLYIISYLDDTFVQQRELECLSVQQINDFKNAIAIVIKIGILKNLQVLQEKSAIVCYRQLLAILYSVTICFKSPLLKSLLLTNHLKPILLTFYQIVYRPLKLPNVNDEYNELVKDRDNFASIFNRFTLTIHPILYIKETMLLLDRTSPNWLKKSLSNTLSDILCRPNGVQNVVCAMFDSVGLDEDDDSTKSWNILLTIAKLIVTSKRPDFVTNTCKQLCELLTSRSRPHKPFERLFALCTKLLYQQDKNLCEDVFIRNVFEPLKYYTNEPTFESETLGSAVEQSVRICYYLTADCNFDIPPVPVDVILPVSDVIFRLFLVSTTKSNEYNDILLNLFLHAEAFKLFDTFLFGYPHLEILNVQKNLEFCSENSQIFVKRQRYSVKISVLQRSEAILKIIENSIKIRTLFFSYLLNCLSEPDKYLCNEINTHLLDLEDTPILPERRVAVYKLLSELSSDQRIQIEISKNPENVTKYLTTVIQSCIETKTHKSDKFDSDRFQTLFLSVMLLQIFIDNASCVGQFTSFVAVLKLINDECTNAELQELCRQILVKLESGRTSSKKSAQLELDIALRDMCDPLLPVRGHALMTLSKLIENRNKDAMDKKHYILNIFMQSLKNEDSFIYLSAVGGLAAMGDVFSDTVLNIIADEYVDFSRKGSEDGHEVRIKLGEVLVRITKILGEMAPKYKTLLLNTFLEVTKDDDHLMRASTLSNLGEVCKVLGYKLGTIVSEVLVCVHSIITTDKAPEPRRAAVTVLRQLFIGLEREMIVFLKDDILPIYRTLKNIYNNDSDDVMKLQAQLALEQLNENMKDFVFPNPTLHTEKKIVILD